MTTTLTARPERPATPVAVIALQYANPNRLIGTPIVILCSVALVTVLISVAIVRSGETLSGSGSNGSVLYSTLGFQVAMGVMGVSTGFPFALALGATRRAFVLGNLATQALQALTLAVAATVLLGVELVTGGWFVGARVFDVTVLGNGSAPILFITMLLATLTTLAVGGLYGAVWVRFGARGPVVLSLAIALGLAIALLVALPAITAAFAEFQTWWLLVGAAVVIAAATAGQYAALRSASVR